MFYWRKTLHRIFKTEFLNKYIENSPGPIKDEHGKILGEHIGLMFYTLGQRQGLGIGGSKTSNGEPWFVAEKSIKENTLIVAQGHAHPLLFKDGLIAKKPHWIHGALGLFQKNIGYMEPKQDTANLMPLVKSI